MQTISFGHLRASPVALSSCLLQQFANRVGGRQKRPSRNRQEGGEHKRFNGELDLILAREKNAGELAERSTRRRSCYLLIFADCSLNLYHAHDSAYAAR